MCEKIYTLNISPTKPGIPSTRNFTVPPMNACIEVRDVVPLC